MKFESVAVNGTTTYHYSAPSMFTRIGRNTQPPWSPLLRTLTLHSGTTLRPII